MNSEFRFVSVLLLIALLGGANSVRADTFTVTPTGAYPDDVNNLQAAVDAAGPGDVIHLATGTFNFAGLADGDVGVVINTANLTLEGEAGTTIEGPGLFDTNLGVIGFLLRSEADHCVLRGLTLERFELAILATFDVDALVVEDNRFIDNQFSIWATGGGYDGHRIVANRFVAPSLETVSLTFSIRLREHRDFTITDNVLVGPGIDPSLIGTLFAASTGIQLRDNLPRPERSRNGLIARNHATDFDLAIQSTSNGAIIQQNEVSKSRFAIFVGTVGGRVLTTGAYVSSNLLEDNVEYGLAVAATRDSQLLHNDCRFNGTAGIVFLDGTDVDPPITSINNRSVHNTGSVRNMPGNRGGDSRGREKM